MNPLPEAVQRAFPCAPGCLPERPWWGFCQRHDGADRYRRNDDVPSDREQLVYIIHPTAKQAAAHDAKRPIPHPGYRAGQVWADDAGRSVVCANERGSFVSAVVPGPLSLDGAGYRYLMADPACPHLAPWSPCEVKP